MAPAKSLRTQPRRAGSVSDRRNAKVFTAFEFPPVADAPGSPLRSLTLPARRALEFCPLALRATAHNHFEPSDLGDLDRAGRTGAAAVAPARPARRRPPLLRTRRGRRRPRRVPGRRL